MVEYLLNWDGTYKEKENGAPTTAEDVKFASTLISLYFSRWETRNRFQLDLLISRFLINIFSHFSQTQFVPKQWRLT